MLRPKRLAVHGVLAALAFTIVGGWLLLAGVPADATDVTVYKSPWCGCCGAWVDHLRDNGFDVRVEEQEDLAPVKARLGVPPELQSCHTAIVDGYAIEGHVPAADIHRLLTERPAAKGLAVPGMPIGSPGMEMDGRQDAYDVILFGNDQRSIFAHH